MRIFPFCSTLSILISSQSSCITCVGQYFCLIVITVLLLVTFECMMIFLGGGSAPLEWYSDILLDFLFLVFLAKSPPIWHTVCGTDVHVGRCFFALPWRSFCDLLCPSPLSWCWTCWVASLRDVLYTSLCWKPCLYSFLVLCFFSWPSCLCWWSMASACLLKQGSMQVSFFSLWVCLMVNLASEKLLDWIIFSQNFN